MAARDSEPSASVTDEELVEVLVSGEIYERS